MTSPSPSAPSLKASRSTQLFLAVLALVVCVLYAQGLNNQLFFDDARLTDGSIFGNYGSLLQLRMRMLSYGSFVWLQDLFGEGWWKQRVFNLLVHLCTTAGVYALLSLLLKATRFSDEQTAQPCFAAAQTAALRLGVGLFALNPVAVYAVAYLVQRSTLMATLWTVLVCLCFVRGLVSQQRRWFVLTALSYVLAVASKEAAVMAVSLLVPLYVFVRRPPPRKILILVAAALLALLAMAGALYALMGNVIGAIFDENSRAYAAQLERLSPGVSARLYPLSILNQAAHFFHYGALWLLPNPAWLSVDLRPEFPLSLLSMPQAIGALAFVALLLGSAWLVARGSDAWGLLGLCLLMPALLFFSEFATVWVQDPFALYRSYLWAFMLPGVVVLALSGFSTRTLYPVTVVVLLLLAGVSLERLHSLQDARSAWADAAGKIDLNAAPNAVGRWRPLFNLGAEQAERGNHEDALRYFSQAQALGEPMGSAAFSAGVSLQQLNRQPEALVALAKAESMGFTEAALFYHRGESLFALGRFPEALASYSAALARPQDPAMAAYTRVRRAEAATVSSQLDAARLDYEWLLKQDADNPRYQVGLGMVYIGLKNTTAALRHFDAIIAKKPSGQAYYGRAVAHCEAGDRAACAKDLEVALRTDPKNPVYQALHERLAAPAPVRGAKKS